MLKDNSDLEYDLAVRLGSKRYFCDFCLCDSCKYGESDVLTIMHAPTSDGRWICDVCYIYDQCMTGPNRNPEGPCKDKNCAHRPKLIGDWVKQINMEKNQMCDNCGCDKEYPLPVDHPRLVAVCGWLYDHSFGPAEAFVSRMYHKFFNKAIEDVNDNQS